MITITHTPADGTILEGTTRRYERTSAVEPRSAAA